MPKSRRSRRDPDKPKRGKSAFLLFSQYTRPIVQQEKPGLSFAETAKEVARRWKEVNPDEKAELERKSALDRQRYHEEMKTYEPPQEYPDGNKKRRNKKKEGPKRNVSSFMWFCQEARKQVKLENPEAKMTEISALLGKKWNAMDADARAPFEKLAAQDKERYQRESKAYQEAKAKSMAEMEAAAQAQMEARRINQWVRRDWVDLEDEEGYADFED